MSTHAPGYAGGKIYDKVVTDGSSGAIYSDPFMIPKGETWSLHIELDDDSTTYAGTIQLWASNKPNPDESDDSDWVEMVAAHGWDGFPALAGTPDFTASGDQKDFVDVGVSGALWYRLEITRSAGSGTISCWLCKKDMK